ncbi:MAG: winged helix-turn-helix domain-containing protein, partial [Actinomycetota bacterium]
AKRRYGYYVLPFLDGEEIAALIDPKMDRATSVLSIERLHALNGTSGDRLKRVKEAIEDLGEWLGATDIRIPRPTKI